MQKKMKPGRHRGGLFKRLIIIALAVVALFGAVSSSASALCLKPLELFCIGDLISPQAPKIFQAAEPAAAAKSAVSVNGSFAAGIDDVSTSVDSENISFLHNSVAFLKLRPVIAIRENVSYSYQKIMARVPLARLNYAVRKSGVIKFAPNLTRIPQIIISNENISVGLKVVEGWDNLTISGNRLAHANGMILNLDDLVSSGFSVEIDKANHMIIVGNLASGYDALKQQLLLDPSLQESCGTLSSANTEYQLTQDVSSTGTCFTVAADNVTIDCQGYKMLYANFSAGNAIDNTGVNSTTVKNCIIAQENRTISRSAAFNIVQSNNSVIINNTINTTGNFSYGIQLQRSNFTNISGNTINTTANVSYGISLLTSAQNNLTSNTIRTLGTSAYGINLTASSDNNLLLSNTILTPGTGGVGIFLASSSNNNATSNTINSSSSAVYILANSDNNIVDSNRINTTGGDSIFADDSGSNDPDRNTIKNNIIITAGSLVSGIAFFDSFDTIIEDNTVTHLSTGCCTEAGISVAGTSDNIRANVSRNTVVTGISGIIVWNANVVNVTENNVNTTGSSGGDGIEFISADSVIVRGNNINASGSDPGIKTASGNSDNNNIVNNKIIVTSTGSGISLTLGTGNTIDGNVINTTGLGAEGIILTTLRNNITNNNITTSGNVSFGISIAAANFSNHTNNIIKTTGNLSFAIQLTGSVTNNSIRNNIFNTTALAVNVTNTAQPNNFSLAAITAGTNIVGGSNLGGNFYDNSTVGGQAAWSLNCSDTNGDAICDTSLTHAANNVDFFPLTLPVECGTLDTAGKTYAMSQALTATGTCFTVAADSVTLDCNGFTVTYATSTEGYGVNITANSSTVKNCIFLQQDGTIMNSTAIFTIGSNNSIIINNTINTTGNYSFGIELRDSNFTNASYNVINTTGNFSHGISLLRTTWSNVSANTVTTVKTSAVALNLTQANDNLIASNVVNTSGASSHGVFAVNSDRNSIASNTLTTGGGASAGVFLFDDSDYNVVNLNTVGTSGGDSLGVNMVTGTGHPQDNNVTSNVVTTKGTRASGIHVYVTTNSRELILNNTVNTSGAGAPAIYINKSAGNNITGNWINTSGGATTNKDSNGVLLAENSDFNTVDFNQIRTTANNMEAVLIGRLTNDDSDFLNVTNNIIATGTASGILISSGHNGDGHRIISNTILSGDDGISVNSVANTFTVAGNTVNTTGTTSHGIYAAAVAYGNITGNVINTSGTTSYGIYLNDVSDKVLDSNTIRVTGGTSYGIAYLAASEYPDLTTNYTSNKITVTGSSGAGIYISDSITARRRLVRNNVINTTGSSVIGLQIFHNNLTNVTGNNITTAANNSFGISLIAGNNSILSGNIITTTGNLSFSVQLENGARNNTFYNNVFNTTALAVNVTNSANANNFSLSAITAGTNIVGGSNLGGNYYDNSTAGGQLAFSKTCLDVDNDAICDANLTHAGNNTDFFPLSLVVDTTPPNVTTISPAAGAVVSGSFLVNASVNDSQSNVNLAHLTVYNSSGNVTGLIVMTLGAGTNTSGFRNVTFDPSSLVDGRYNLSVNATDIRGNVNISQNVSFLLDTTAQVIDYAAPSDSNASFVSRSWIFLNFSFTETNNDTFMIRNGSTNWTNVNASSGYFFYNFTNRPDGNYTFFGWLNDSAGNVAQTVNRTVVVDSTQPVITAIRTFSNSSGHLFQKSNTTSAVVAYFNSILPSGNSDGGGGQEAIVEVTYTDLYRSSLSGNLTFGDVPSNITTADPTRIAYTIETGLGNATAAVYANDTANNSATATVRFILDINDTVTADNSSSSFTWFTTNVTINLTAVDVANGSGANRTLWCTYTSGTTPCTPSVEVANPTDFRLPLNCSGDGSCTIRVRYYSIDNVSNNESGGTNGGQIRESNTVNIATGGADVQDSLANNSAILNSSFVRQSNITNSTVNSCRVVNSIVIRSTLSMHPDHRYNCTISESVVIDSNITSAIIEKRSLVDPSTIIDSVITNSTILNSTVSYSRIENSIFCGNFSVWSGAILNNTLIDGRLEFNGSVYFGPMNLSSICAGVPLSPVGTLSANPSIVNNTASIAFRYSGTRTGYTVTIGSNELSKLDNTSTKSVTLADNGAYPDDVANDAVYSGNYSMSSLNNVSDGNKTIVAQVFDNLGNNWTVSTNMTLDNTNPNASVSIFGLSPAGFINISTEYTFSRAVTLQASFNDSLAGVGNCRFANENLAFTGWEDCTTIKAWLLSEGTGNKTVVVEVRDIAGNINRTNDTIFLNTSVAGLDITPPNTPTVVDDGLYTNFDSTLHARWNSTDYENELLHIPLEWEYRIAFDNFTRRINETWQYAGVATEDTVYSLNLSNSTNYTFEVRAINTAGIRSANGTSDGITVDISPPSAPAVNSTAAQNTWSSNNAVSFNWSSTDTISGISSYSYVLDTNSTTIPDNVPEAENDHTTLASSSNDGKSALLKFNNTGNASAVFVEVKGNLSANDVVRVTLQLAESTTGSPDAMGFRVYLVTAVPTSFAMNGSNASLIVDTSNDISFVSSMLDATSYTVEVPLGTPVTGSRFFVAVAGDVADDNNRHNLLLAVSNSSIDSSTQSYQCGEVTGSCSNTTDTAEYGIKVDVRDLKQDDIWDRAYTVGDGRMYFHVKAKDRAGNFGQATNYTVLVDTSAPSTPQLNQTSQYTNISSAAFNWTQSRDADSGIDNYSLQVDNSSDFSSPEFYAWVNNVTNYTVTGLTADATYYARVHSRNLAGVNSSWSSAVSAVIDTTAPSITFSKPSSTGVVVSQDVALVVKTNEKATCTYSLNSGAYLNFTYTNSTYHETRMSASTGSNTLLVKCHDAILNENAPASTTFTVSTTSTASSITLQSPSFFTGDIVQTDVIVTTSSSVLLGELGSGAFTVKINGGAIQASVFDNGAGNYTLVFDTPVTNGTYTLDVNVGSATATTTLTVRALLFTVQYVQSDISSNSGDRLIYFVTGNFSLGLATDSKSFAKSSTSSALNMTSDARAGTAYIFVTRQSGGVERVEGLLKERKFLDSMNPSFGYAIDQNTFIVFTNLEYDDISLAGNKTLTIGRYNLIIENKGFDATLNKTKLEVRVQ